MGSLQEGKGILELLKTVLLLKQWGNGESIHFNVVGEWFSDEFKSEALRFVDEYDLRGVVNFPGQLTGDAKWQAYHAANLFFFPDAL